MFWKYLLFFLIINHICFSSNKKHFILPFEQTKYHFCVFAFNSIKDAKKLENYLENNRYFKIEDRYNFSPTEFRLKICMKEGRTENQINELIKNSSAKLVIYYTWILRS